METEMETEQGRWQEAIYTLLCKQCPEANIDGKGCDSGDPLDVTLAEVGQGLAHWIDRHDELSAQLATARERLKELENQDSPTWPHVLAFAKRMEAKLSKNRHKGDRDGWIKDHPWNLVERILDETVEVQQSFTGTSDNIWSPDPEKTADECADVANFCMMVADRVTVKAPHLIDAPAICAKCGTKFVSPTTGKLLDRCHCGGQLASA